MKQPLNKKGRPFSWSYSRWNDFNNCPYKYAQASFYCTLPYVQSPAAIWGDRVHKAAEMFLKHQPHDDVEALKPVRPYCEKMVRSGCPIDAELEIVLNRDLVPIRDWFSKKAWLRVKIDVVLTKTKNKLNIYDWKTGKMKHDDEQVKLNALALSCIRPEIEEYSGLYVWLKDKRVSHPTIITKKDIPLLWEEWMARVSRMEEAWASENFSQRPSGLCAYCGVQGCRSRAREYNNGR